MLIWIPLALCLIFVLAVWPRKRGEARPGSIDVFLPFHHGASQWPRITASLLKLHGYETDRCIAVENGSHSHESNLTMQAGLRLWKAPQTISGKKAALQWAIAQSEADWIFTTDADAQFQADILHRMRQAADPQTHMVIAPVMQYGPHFLGWISCLESLCIWTVTASSARICVPLSCSGAGLLFRRSSWIEVKGYTSHLHMPSGDDVLFMDALWRQHRDGIRVIWDRKTLVRCDAPSTWSDWLHQHRRWASKSDHLRHPLKRLVLLPVLVWMLLPWMLIAHPSILAWVLAIEFVWLTGICIHFRIPYRVMLAFLPFRWVYPFLAVASCIPNRTATWQKPS